MEGLSESTKKQFKAARYMDDILLVMRSHGWHKDRFCEAFQSECYMPPLKLEAQAGDTFLETTFRIEGDAMHFRLKNVNKDGAKQVWRYHAYDSYTPITQKRSTLVAVLKKVDKMASSDGERMESAVDKLREFQKLGYPLGEVMRACGRVAVEQGRGVWFAVAAAATRLIR